MGVGCSPGCSKVWPLAGSLTVWAGVTASFPLTISWGTVEKA